MDGKGEMIGACESEMLASGGVPPDNPPLYLGMDVGRSKDLSVIITCAKIGDTLHMIECEELRKMAFHDQLKILVDKARARNVQRVCIDSTGIGAMLAEEAQRIVGGIIMPVQFNVKTKGEMYSLMRRTFEERTIRIPVNRDLREDLHAVQKIASTGGSITYSAPRNSDGHSDRAAALALAITAANQKGDFFMPFSGRKLGNYDTQRI